MIPIDQRVQALYLRPEPMMHTELDRQVRCWLFDQGIECVDDFNPIPFHRVILIPHGYDGCAQMSLRSVSFILRARVDKKAVEIVRFVDGGFELSPIGCYCDLHRGKQAAIERRLTREWAIAGISFLGAPNRDGDVAKGERASALPGAA